LSLKFTHFRLPGNEQTLCLNPFYSFNCRTGLVPGDVSENIGKILSRR
jgi:hypothetical protein